MQARLRALDYHYPGDLLACAECGPLSVLRIRMDLIDNDWDVGCDRCGHRNTRTYSDPIRAILIWNANQRERSHLPRKKD
ncbi:MAG: hypothetical protein VBE63_18315 [Lamprobacter sp.]|uniref:hypothetical protein n=1 Tax=Lamprobacter sp. TaxID=3100796 RepID=UPI002B25A951|nr:hypothetical protein [Lamprobacter sp.]MEA3641870.1 hypothetical protein [Lamprobacter sp.]